MHSVLVLNSFIAMFALTRLVTALRAGLHGFPGAWRRCRTLVPALPDYKGGDALYGCNSLEWNDHAAKLRLALHPENRTLRLVQLRNLDYRSLPGYLWRR